tara:strand:+ start:4323 stop:4475 length:153 start_codon:yes stop_codon:yes gene_type:complete
MEIYLITFLRHYKNEGRGRVIETKVWFFLFFISVHQYKKGINAMHLIIAE